MAGELTLHVHPTGDLLDATLQCEADVFEESFGNTREQLAEEYGPYDDATAWVAVTDATDEVVAAGRTIFPGPAGFKSLADMGEPPWELDLARSVRRMGLDVASTIDVTTVAVRKGLRGRGLLVSATVFHGILSLARANACTHVVSLVDVKVRHRFDAIGLHFHTVPGAWSAPYLGSPASTPIWGRLPQMIVEQRREAPDAYRLVTLGQGLDDVRLPPLEAFRLPVRPDVVDLREPSRAGVLPGPRDADAVDPVPH